MRQRHEPTEPATFRVLYEAHGPFVLRLLRRFRVHESEVRDVAQEVWSIVERSASSYDPDKGTRRAWIAGIAHNASRDWHRTRRRRPEFSQSTDREPADPHPTEAETNVAEARRQQAILSFVERALPNEAQREALLYHEVDGMTLKEIASATGANVWTVQWRIAMARKRLKAAHERLTDEEREKLRAVVLPLGGVDELFRALRDAPTSDAEVARVWEAVSERIAREGGSVDAPLGQHGAGPALAPPRGYTWTGMQLTGAFAGMFLLGAASGAAGHALWSRDAGRVASIEADRLPEPVQPPKPLPEPTATASAAPRATGAAVPMVRESERWILKRARAALQKNAPEEALEQANKHASLFRHSAVATEREEIAIRALLQLDRRPEAEARAEKLVRTSPQMRPAMEALLGRSFP